MKVMLHYEDNRNIEFHKTLKITLPKSWKIGPTSQLLEQFIESYNPKFPDNQLIVKEMHLCQRKPIGTSSYSTELVPLPSNAVVVDEISDRGDVYICHGPSETKEEINAKLQELLQVKQATLANTVACTHFGCKQRFPKGGPYPTNCIYHKSPPVFHETAKFWSCCPDKKAYDWEDFQNIPGCQTGTCTEIKDDTNTKQFLGGTDLREAANGGPKLKSIDDFNKTLQSGGAEAAPVLERLQHVLVELGIEVELYNQVVDGMKQELSNQASNEPELLQLIATELGSKLKTSLKAIAAEQLRIK